MFNFKSKVRILALLLVLVLALSACNLSDIFGGNGQPSQTTTEQGGSTTSTSTTTSGKDPTPDEPAEEFDFATMVPEYSEEVAPDGYVVINGNVPFFKADEITTECFEHYGERDSLGRCTVAFACLGKDLLPTEDKGSISSVKPTGWHSVTYPETNNQSLYNRSHLIAWSLTGENANWENLITGTTYMNQHTMQIFENQLLSYVRSNDTHVMYRVTPIFEGNNLLASGVLMEAYSVEDNGEDITFCVYVYNVQKGIIIDYATGDSRRDTSNDVVEDVEFDGTFYDFSKFDGTGTVSSYVEKRTTSDGWTMAWGRVDEQSFPGATISQVILNGNTSKKGTLTSAAISGGISELYMNYGLSFSDSKINFTVQIIQNGVVIATQTVSNSSATQSTSYELHWILDEAIEGDFVIKITNNCPSNANSNKDRLSVWNLGWK